MEVEGWIFVIGASRSGTTLVSDLLKQSSRVFIAPETKYFQQVWSQRNLLRLLPRRRRVRLIVDHIVSSEYPADPPTFPSFRADFVAALNRAERLDEGFLSILRPLSDSPLLGEKTPWHTVFVKQIRRIAPDARFVAVTRDAPATVASTHGREGFRRVGTLTQCIARWIYLNRELLRARKSLPEDRFLLVRFEDLVRDPGPVMERVCEFLGVRLEPAMLRPTSQDSSLRSGEGGQGFDRGALDRWRDELTPAQVRRIRAHTWEISAALGYSPDPADAEFLDRLAVGSELTILSAGVRLMRSGFYPFGPVRRILPGRPEH